jgi:hypothetical protein
MQQTRMDDMGFVERTPHHAPLGTGIVKSKGLTCLDALWFCVFLSQARLGGNRQHLIVSYRLGLKKNGSPSRRSSRSKYQLELTRSFGAATSMAISGLISPFLYRTRQQKKKALPYSSETLDHHRYWAQVSLLVTVEMIFHGFILGVSRIVDHFSVAFTKSHFDLNPMAFLS